MWRSALLVILAVAQAAPPLFLSEYLDNPQLGRKLSLVQGLPYPAPSHSGYFTIGNGQNTFFWYFANANGNPNAPTLTWLQGGPGASSMFGLFAEHGPFYVLPDARTLVPRNLSWTQNYNMIYIDNPLGVGFSYTETVDGFVTNESDVGLALFLFLEQFFTIFDDIAANPLIIAGESYGGKYAPSAACYLHNQIVSGRSSIKLSGVSIGDGAINPAIQFTRYADLLFYLSMADRTEQNIIKGYERNITAAINAGDWRTAFTVFDALLNGDFFPFPTYFRNITGLTDYFNFLSPQYPPNPYQQYLSSAAVQDMLHVGAGRVFWDYNATVERYLIDDWMKPVTSCLSVLLENYPVLVYNGQNDIILGPALTVDTLEQLRWSGQKGWNAAKKAIWTDPADKTDVRGYVKAFGNLTHVIVRDAGHMVPSDQPQRAFDMITRFVGGKPWSAFQ